MNHSKSFPYQWVVGGLLVASVIFYRWFFDPAQENVFGCKFHELTGFLCPGCGSQRALYHLMHFRAVEALKMNALFVLAIPYAAFWLYLDLRKKSSPALQQLKRILYGKYAFWIILSIIAVFGVLRNL
ncbi:MAG: DUF2752 domain-containing protein [Cytophagales bacterium]|nr:DUF2752 domain-containing protein [Cytophagales bacterium]